MAKVTISPMYVLSSPHEVFGAFTTMRKAEIWQEILKRDGIVSTITAIKLNQAPEGYNNELSV